MTIKINELIQMLNNPPADWYGTILRKNGTLGMYWSSVQWVSPKDALESHYDDWFYLGVEGWWPDVEHKDIFLYFKLHSPDWPEWPGEYVDLDYGRSVAEIARVREWWEVVP